MPIVNFGIIHITSQVTAFGDNRSCFLLRTQNPITTQPCTPRLPKMCQPDIDFTAPEIQMHNFCNLSSDVYSFVILSCWMFNSGKPIMPSYWKCANYNRQLDMVSATTSFDSKQFLMNWNPIHWILISKLRNLSNWFSSQKFQVKRNSKRPSSLFSRWSKGPNRFCQIT